jgi:hypothetical protein
LPPTPGHPKTTVFIALQADSPPPTVASAAIDLQAVANASSSHDVSESKSLTVGAALAGSIGSQEVAPPS